MYYTIIFAQCQPKSVINNSMHLFKILIRPYTSFKNWYKLRKRMKQLQQEDPFIYK
jgi:hypothetical protein